MNKIDPDCNKIVKKVIKFKHKNKMFIYETLGPANHKPDLMRYAILVGVKKEEITEFKVEIINFEDDVEAYFSSWFLKPVPVKFNFEKEKCIASKVAKNLSNKKKPPGHYSKSKACLESSSYKKKSI